MLLEWKRKLLPLHGALKGDSGGGSGTTTTVQKADPWAGQQPYLTYGFEKAQQQYQTGAPQYYPGQITAGIDPLTELAQQNLVGTVPAMQDFTNLALASNAFSMGAGRDPQTNPYLQSAIQAAINPMLQNFNDAGGVMSAIRTGAQGAEQFGGSRQGIAEGIAASRLNQQIGDVAATMANQGYQGAQDAATRATALAPTTMNMLSAPSTTLDAVGAQRQMYEQQLINDAIQKWNWQQNLPANMLTNYMNLIQGNWGGTSTATSTGTSGYRRNPLMGALGGAMSGFTLGNMFEMGPLGAGVGALLSFL
jgi:hypothetical protein